MKKFLFILFSALLLCFGASAASLDLSVGENVVNILDGEVSVRYSEACPYIENDIVMIPVRIVAETFGALVEWSDADRVVTVTDNSKVVKFTAGSAKAEFDGVLSYMESAAVIINGRTMVPARFLCDAFGYYMRQIDGVSSVILTNDMPVMRVGKEYIYLDEFALMFNADRDKYIGEEELLAKSCISNLYDRNIMYNAGVELGFNLEDNDISEIADLENNENTLESIGIFLLAKQRIADKFSDYLSAESIPDDEEVEKYFLENYKDSVFTDEVREEIRYLLGYENFVESWNVLYNETDDESFYEIDELIKLVK